jgi:tetratricopeptide (TPR) repeat protein/energy-coupling factor transporter ATP-binding protein EcfA2
MMNQPVVPPHNVSDFRLDTFVGRQTELAQLTTWLRESHVVAITGSSGIGKSSLATALALALMPQFDEGVIWVSAFGSDEFRVYDIIRAIEDVLVTGITSQPPDQWEILALQQIYGRRRLIILDEITQTTEETAHQIAETIGRVGPGGPGRVILVGRHLRPPFIDLVKSYHLELDGLTEVDASTLVAQTTQSALPASNFQKIMDLTQGHPLALKLLLSIWKPTSSFQNQLDETVAQHATDDWGRRFEAIVDVALNDLETAHPAAAQLITRFTLSSGGGDFDAMQTLYWQSLGPVADLRPALDELVRRGLLQYDAHEDRYLLHPALRRLLIAKRFAAFPPDEQQELARGHAQYYLTVARGYERIPPHQWNRLERDWANVRQGVEEATQKLEAMADASVEDLLARVDSLGHFGARRADDLSLVRDYALALRTYCVQRQPPLGFRWLAAGLVAAQALGDSWSRTLIGGRLCTLAYFRGEYDLAETWLRLSLNAFVPIDDKPRLSRVWADLGGLYKAQGRFEEAIAACRQVYALNEAMGNWRGAGSAMMRIGSVCYASGDMENALISHQRALALFQERDDPRGQAMAHNNMGLVHEARGEFQQAIHHYQESARLNGALDNVQGMITAYGNLGSASYESGDFRAAIGWYQKDLTLSEELGDWTGMAATLHNMGHVALEMEDLDAACDYFVRSRDLYARFGLNDFVVEEEMLIQIVQDRRVVRG